MGRDRQSLNLESELEDEELLKTHVDGFGISEAGLRGDDSVHLYEKELSR